MIAGVARLLLICVLGAASVLAAAAAYRTFWGEAGATPALGRVLDHQVNVARETATRLRAVELRLLHLERRVGESSLREIYDWHAAEMRHQVSQIDGPYVLVLGSNHAARAHLSNSCDAPLLNAARTGMPLSEAVYVLEVLSERPPALVLLDVPGHGAFGRGDPAIEAELLAAEVARLAVTARQIGAELAVVPPVVLRPGSDGSPDRGEALRILADAVSAAAVRAGAAVVDAQAAVDALGPAASADGADLSTAGSRAWAAAAEAHLRARGCPG